MEVMSENFNQILSLIFSFSQQNKLRGVGNGQELLLLRHNLQWMHVKQ